MVLYGFLVFPSRSPFFTSPRDSQWAECITSITELVLTTPGWIPIPQVVKLGFPFPTRAGCDTVFLLRTYFLSMPWVSKVPSTCGWYQSASVAGLLLLFPHHEATLLAGICSGILTNCRLFAFYLWGYVLGGSSFQANPPRGQRRTSGEGRDASWLAASCWNSSCC